MIYLFNLSLQYQEVKKEINHKIKQVLTKGSYILGEEVRNFEKEFAKYLGVKYAVGVASGTDALKIAIKTLDLKFDDEVILPVNVYPTAFGVVEAGVKIKLADIDPETYNIDPTSLERVITKKTKAIIPVHLYGQPCQMAKILKIAKKYKLFVIEDCAQAHGAEYKGKKVGTLGDVSCFSFYPTKPLGAYGDGGMIITNNKKIYERAILLRMYGEKKRYQSEILGYNSRLDEVQAAVLRIKLKYLDKWNKKRQEKVAFYKKKLKTINQIELPGEIKGTKGIYHLFVVKAEKRDNLKNFLEKNEIITSIHYPIPIHLTKSFSFLGYKNGDFPVAEKVSQEVLSLPLYAEIRKQEILEVVEKIKNFYEKTT